jgi:hypothetical protein
MEGGAHPHGDEELDDAAASSSVAMKSKRNGNAGGAGLTTAALGAFSWIARRASRLVPGRKGNASESMEGGGLGMASPSASVDAALDDSVLVGFASMCAIDGLWRNGRLTFTSTLFFADGRIAQANYLSGRPAIELPHRGNLIRPDLSGKTAMMCGVCKQPFTWRRGAQSCRLCSRIMCTACLSDMTLQPHVTVPSTDSLHGRNVGASGGDPDANGGASNHNDADALTPADKPLPNVKACKDCFNAVQMNLTYVTIWQPMKVRPVKVDAAELRALASQLPPKVAALARELPRRPRDAEDLANQLIVEKAVGRLPTPTHKHRSPTGKATPPPLDLLSVSVLSKHAPHDDDYDDYDDDLIVYKGFVAGDRPHQSGTLWFGKDACYTGEFKLGKRHGFGTLTFENGEEYVGNWTDDERDGSGSCRLSDGTFVSGMWAHDRLLTLEYHGYCDTASLMPLRHGLGYGYDADSGTRYNGEWLYGQREGTGTLELANGTVYRGQFKNDKPHGRGKSMGTEGSYIGDFEAGQRQGTGELRTSSHTYSGTFQNGKPHGIVIVHDVASGDVLRTLYVDGAVFSTAFVQGHKQADTAAKACTKCQTAFGMFFRRHHCRCCGMVFCDKCSPNRSNLPSHFRDFCAAPEAAAGVFPLALPEAQYRTCAKCSEMLQNGSCVGSWYYGTPLGLEYHGQLSAAPDHKPMGLGMFRLPKSRQTIYVTEAEAQLPVVLEQALAEVKDAAAVVVQPQRAPPMTEQERRSHERVVAWWDDVATRSGVLDVVTPSRNASGGATAFTILEDRDVTDFPPATQELGFNVAVFLDPLLKKHDPPSRDERIAREAHRHVQPAPEPRGRVVVAGDDDTPALVVPALDVLQDHDGHFDPASMPNPPTVPSVTLERPALPVEPTHEQISECVAEARRQSGARLGVPPPGVMKLWHICAPAPTRPPRKQSFDATTWQFTPAILPAPRVRTQGDNSNVDVRGSIACGSPLHPPTIPPIASYALPELEVGFAVEVSRDLATGDLVANTQRIYPRGSIHSQPMTSRAEDTDGGPAATVMDGPRYTSVDEMTQHSSTLDVTATDTEMPSPNPPRGATPSDLEETEERDGPPSQPVDGGAKEPSLLTQGG